MVTIGRNRVRGRSLRTDRAYDKGKVGVLPLILFVALVPFYLISRSLSRTTTTTTTPTRYADEGASRTCGLWLMESTFKPGDYGVFTSISRASAGERVTEADMLVPIIDVNKNEWSPWQDYVTHLNISRALQLDNLYLSDVFVPGFESLAMANMVQCSDELANVEAERNELKKDSGGVHRFSHPTAGSFTYHYNYGYQSKRPLLAGEELLLPCSSIRTSTIPEPVHQRPQVPVPLETFFESGICIDNLSSGPSTLPGIGRGAFIKDSVKKGQPITSTPLIHFDRSQTEIVAQTYSPVPSGRQHGITYGDKVAGQQLLLNYCFSHTESNVLLLPIGPSVNYINHQDVTKANAVMSAPYMPGSASNDILTARPSLVVDLSWYGLTVDIVALRDILPGEEIFIDYGDAWVRAWDEHGSKWKPQDAEYIAANDYRRIHKGDPVRTIREQESKPYPANLRTACFLIQHRGKIDRDCMRPCDITGRTGTGMDVLYSATVYPMESSTGPDYCGNVLTENVNVEGLAWDAVQVVNALYSTDSHLGSAFRHEIGMPAGLFPQSWMAADPKPMGDFIASPLKVGELSAIRWKDTGEVVAPNAYRLGLDANVRLTLLDYCDRTGITELMRTSTAGGNSQIFGSEAFAGATDGDRWILQRPDKSWLSDMHWISPADESTHQSYLQVLGAAGFNDVLKSIGESLGMDGLAAFHLSFIAVSHCSKGLVHKDVGETGNKTFNVIIPLMLAEMPGPEQELVDASTLKVGRILNSYDTALLVGDDTEHATSPIDYRVTKEFRLAATVYVADINEENVEAIMKYYTQPYPPKNRDTLLGWAGTHWKKDDPTASLPKLGSGHILHT